MRTNQPLATALIKISDDHTQNRDQYNAAYKQTPHENIRREAISLTPSSWYESMSSVSDLFSTTTTALMKDWLHWESRESRDSITNSPVNGISNYEQPKMDD